MRNEIYAPDGGRLAANIVHFVRVLRAAGLPLGPGKALDAVQAVTVVGVTHRQDFYWTLHAVLVQRREQRELFDQAFHVFWRNPGLLSDLGAMALPDETDDSPPADTRPLSRRLSDVLGRRGEATPRARQQLERQLTFSSLEQLRHKDFETMTGAELAEARRALQWLDLQTAPAPTRRFRPARRGPRIDLRASLKASLKTGGTFMPLLTREPRHQSPPLVLLCDISGSMERYSRMLLHFAHALTGSRQRVHTFVFGTRLTNITRPLRHKDVDVALAAVTARVNDWGGGTRIGRSLHDFNRHWSRRVLGQGAQVLLISDGLDRDAGEHLGREMERLHKSCRRLIWLNPLLRYAGFQPKALGVRAMLPHVDDFRPAHNLNSLIDLSAALQRSTHERTNHSHRSAARRASVAGSG